MIHNCRLHSINLSLITSGAQVASQRRKQMKSKIARKKWNPQFLDSTGAQKILAKEARNYLHDVTICPPPFDSVQLK